jgi:hypothetical protein
MAAGQFLFKKHRRLFLKDEVRFSKFEKLAPRFKKRKKKVLDHPEILL